MDAPPPDYPLMRWSSREAPPGARVESWRDLLTRKLLPTDVEPLTDGPFCIDVQLRALAGLRFSWGTVDASRYIRSRNIASKDDDDFAIIVNLDGQFVSAQSGREVVLGAGDACLVACIDPGVFSQVELGRLICIRVPEGSLAPLVPRLHDRTDKIIPRDNAALRLLTSYIRVLDENQALSTPGLRTSIVTHIQNLAALAVNPTEDNFACVEHNGLRAARLRAIKSYILENLARSDLTVAKVAAHIRLSPRSVQMLLEDEDTTFSEFALHARLSRVCAGLTDERKRLRGIGDIALECGFGDISYFNRAFRRRYGVSPSEIRHQRIMQCN